MKRSMQEKQLFEYAVIRIVPRVEREEFLNAGIILYVKRPSFLGCLYHLYEERLKAIDPSVDIAEIAQHLRSFEAICQGRAGGGPIAQLDAASRFRWLTATRSTVVQASKVHPGFCAGPQEALQRLYEQLVLLPGQTSANG
jgi:hypothetical protein